MTLPAAVNVVRCLIWETFWQSVASRIFWVTLAVTAMCMLFCLSISVSGGKLERDPGEDVQLLPPNDPQFTPTRAEQTGVQTIHGEMTLAFGAVRVPHARDAVDSVRGIQLLLASGVAGTLGLLLTLVWTAGFMPTFLEPNAASLLLTKPVPRWLLLLGKFLGTNLFVGMQATIFVVGTWSVLGLTTGVWEQGYFLAVPLLMLQFAFFYSFSMFLAVATRSTIVCIVGSMLFWCLCSAVNAGRIEAVTQLVAMPEWTRGALEAIYWLLPKPVDMGKLMSDALQADRYFAEWSALHHYRPAEMSVVSSLLFAAALLGISALDFVQIDY